MSLVEGFLVEWTPQGIQHVRKYVGEENVPQDVKRRRRQVYDMMRHMGQPVLIKHMYNADDEYKGHAVRSDNYSTVYGQTRHNDPISHGVGFVSAEKAEDEWILPDGTLTKADDKPSGAKPAPKYRGFGPGYLAYIIEPDAAEDIFKLNEVGVFTRVQQAIAQAPWFPEINDNDLIINVEISDSYEILDAGERFQAKMTNPITMRGWGNKNGRTENTGGGGANRFRMNQQFEMTLIPESDQLWKVETDR